MYSTHVTESFNSDGQQVH